MEYFSTKGVTAPILFALLALRPVAARAVDYDEMKRRANASAISTLRFGIGVGFAVTCIDECAARTSPCSEQASSSDLGRLSKALDGEINKPSMKPELLMQVQLVFFDIDPATHVCSGFVKGSNPGLGSGLFHFTYDLESRKQTREDATQDQVAAAVSAQAARPRPTPTPTPTPPARSSAAPAPALVETNQFPIRPAPETKPFAFKPSPPVASYGSSQHLEHEAGLLLTLLCQDQCTSRFEACAKEAPGYDLVALARTTGKRLGKSDLIIRKFVPDAKSQACSAEMVVSEPDDGTAGFALTVKAATGDILSSRELPEERKPPRPKITAPSK